MNADEQDRQVHGFVARPYHLQHALLLLSSMAILWLLVAVVFGNRAVVWLLLPPVVVLVATARVRRFRELVLELEPEQLRLVRPDDVEEIRRHEVRTVRLRRWVPAGAYWRLETDRSTVDVPAKYHDRRGRSIGQALATWLGPNRVPVPPRTRPWPPLVVIGADVFALIALIWGLMWLTARPAPIVGECRVETRALVAGEATTHDPADALATVAGTSAVRRDVADLYDDPDRTRRLARLEAIAAWDQVTPDGAYLQAVTFPSAVAALDWQRWIVGEACLYTQAPLEMPPVFEPHAGAAWRYPYGGDGRSSDQLSFVVGDTRYLVLVVGGRPGEVQQLARELLREATGD